MRVTSLAAAAGLVVCTSFPAYGHAALSAGNTVFVVRTETKKQEIPEEARRKLRHEFGNAFLVTRDKVQEELKLTPDQKAKLDAHLRSIMPDAMSFFQRLEAMAPDVRQREFETYRTKALRELEVVLKEVLSPSQRKRLHELESQREGLFGGEAIWKDLQVTDEERMQFMATIQPMQKRIEALLQESQHGGNPHEFQLKVLKLRFELEGKLEALLTEVQGKKWKEMLGKPMEVDALFDLSAG